MQGVAPARSAKFLKRQFLRGLFPVLRRGVILALTQITSEPYKFPHNPAFLFRLLKDFCNDAGADGATAFTDCELQTVVHRDRSDQFDLHIDIISGHDHFRAFR